jgi:hypothetical protein
MPIQARPTDTFTRDNLLIGFSSVEFTPRLAAGGFGATVMLGILSGEELQKEIETLALERGDSGLLTVDRELISSLVVRLQLEVFNFRQDLARYVLASTDPVAVTADAAAAVANDPAVIPSVDSFETFLQLTRADINEASVAVSFTPIVDEAVGTGNGVLGGTQGDFSLDRKIKAIGDVTEFLVGGVDQVANLVAGSTPAAGEIAIEIGEEDSPVTGSGAITFGASMIPALGAAIVATYTPSFTTGAGDIANLTDFVFDPILGRIRFRHAGADASPFRLAAAVSGTSLDVDYTYNRKASHTLKPFTQTTVEGKAVVRHLTDVGINFIWSIPSVSLRITDDALTFDAEDFAVGTLVLNVNDAGGSDRFGTLDLSSEPEANA